MASISSTRANIFMPITVVLRRSRLFRSATMPARSSFSSLVAACCMNRHSLNGRLTAAPSASYARLSPVSIHFRWEHHSKMMDCGARPGGDREGYSTERSRAGTIATPALTRSLLMTHHHLHSSPETCHWGFFEAKLKPVLAIASGDEVTIDTISGGPEVVPDRSRFHVPPELAEVHAKNERMVPGHILTGPVAIEGAQPDDFHETRLMNIPLDQKRMVGRLPWGLDLPLAPFFGVMGVAPPPAWGRITSLIPRAMGGNLDNKELGAGTKLYLPVFVPGALFSCGDGHGVPGDGEVCVTAIETALQGRFRLTLRQDLRLDYPRTETPDHYMTMAMDPDLDQCVVRALRDMIVLLGEKRNLSREDAYTLCSLAADLRVTQTVNGSKGIHCMIAKSLVHG